MRRTRTNNYQELASIVGTVLGAAAIIGLALVLVRLQRGLIGMILAILAAGLFAYWLTEFRKTVRKELQPAAPRKDWEYEVMEGSNEVTVIAEVPGPSEKVKVNLLDRTLQIEGGKAFRRRVSVPMKVEISSFTYLNGVLQVRMKKLP